MPDDFLITVRKVSPGIFSFYRDKPPFIHGTVKTGTFARDEIVELVGFHQSPIVARMHVILGLSTSNSPFQTARRRNLMARLDDYYPVQVGMVIASPDSIKAHRVFECSFDYGYHFDDIDFTISQSGTVDIHNVSVSCYFEPKSGTVSSLDCVVEMDEWIALAVGWRFHLLDESRRVIGAGEVTRV